MSDLRKYIDLVNETDSLEERRIRNPFRAAPTSPKIGTEVVGKDGLTYQWMGKQWVQKAGQKGGKGRIATKQASVELTAQELKSRGNLITRIIKKNPKVSAALAAIVGIKVGGNLAGSGNDTTQAQSNTDPAPNQSGMPADNTPGQSGHQNQNQTEPSASEDLTALKTEIDALIKELEANTDPNVKKELERIKQLMGSGPEPWYDPSIRE